MEQEPLFTKKNLLTFTVKIRIMNEPIGEPSGGVSSSGKLISTSPDKNFIILLYRYSW